MASASHTAPVPDERIALPLGGLLALFTAGFLGILNETVPAGLLPEMSAGLGRSESAVGQTITVYALATAFTAIPLNAALRNHDRRSVLIGALSAFALANAVAATVDSFAVLLVARFVAGVGAGLIWSNIGGTAARIAPESLRGRAIAVAMAGIPAALSLGLPAGTLLGDSAGWHATFGAMAVASVVLIVWMRFALPALPSHETEEHTPAGKILRTPGVAAVVAVVAGYMVAHNLLYTYIGPLADESGVGDQLELILLAFGGAAMVGIWAIGTYADPHHRRLTVASILIVGASALVLRFASASPLILYAGVVAWGLGFGGSATLLLTAAMRAAGTDGVQSIVVTTFNLSIAVGGLLGGLLLAGPGIDAITVVAFALMIPTAVTAIRGRRHAFPSWADGRSR